MSISATFTSVRSFEVHSRTSNCIPTFSLPENTQIQKYPPLFICFFFLSIIFFLSTLCLHHCLSAIHFSLRAGVLCVVSPFLNSYVFCNLHDQWRTLSHCLQRLLLLFVFITDVFCLSVKCSVFDRPGRYNC